jgi:hypothetical protein
LECTGYNPVLRGRSQHEIAIYGTAAEVDGDRYSLSETATEFRLTGPAPANDRIVYIDRVTAAFEIGPLPGVPMSNNNFEYMPRTDDAGFGCKKASQKF